MARAIRRPEALLPVRTHYCAGCGHGIIHRLMAEIIEEGDLRGRMIGVAPIGCAVLAYEYLDVDMSESAHGRTPAVATGMKRVLPEHLVFSYQGDGDLAAIGMTETIHAANRGELITVIFVNNAVYGMTGGQMAPTTLLNQRTSTTLGGRDPAQAGHTIRVCELLATLDGPAYLTRTTVSSPRMVRRTKKAIAKAFLAQEQKAGFSLVEILSPCPTYWRMDPVDSMKWIDSHMTEVFPLGTYRDWTGEETHSTPSD
jgi:2-oxoglutarate/2-oxoacid ferredoxin oxidoreductase subunit beta